MKKKLFYILISIIVLVLGYLNYYSPEKKIKEAAKKVETINAQYESDGYQIKAAKEIDDTEKKESFFENAEAKVKDVDFKGDNMYMDPQKNLELNGNIEGLSSSGWKFFSDKINYNKIKDIIISEVGVRALSLKGIEVSGTTFKSNSKFDYMELKGDVRIKTEKDTITADEANYSDQTKILNLLGNVIVKTKEEGKELTAKLKSASYNLETGFIESNEPFTAEYSGAVLFGDRFIYDEKTGDFRIDNHPEIETSGYKIKLSKITHKGDSDIVDLVGEITGESETSSFTGDNGEYNTATELLTINNFIDKNKEGSVLKADKGVYSKNDNTIHLYGDKEKASYKTKDHVMEAKKLVYNNTTKKGYIINGESYNLLTKEKNSGERIDFDRDSGEYFITGNAKHNTGEHIFESDKLNYNEKTGNLQIPDKYTVTSVDGQQKFTGLSGEYIGAENLFKTPGEIIIETPDEIIHGIDLIYNTKSETGKILKDISIKSLKNDSIINSDTSEFKKNEYIDLIGNLKMEDSQNVVTSEKGRYNLKDGKIYINQLINIKKKDGTMEGTMAKAEIEPKISVIKGNDLNFKNQDYTFKGVNGTFNIPKETFKLNNVTVVSQNGDRFQADKGEGELNKGIINFFGNANGTVKKDVPVNFSGDLFTIYLNKKNGKYEAERVEIKNNGVITRENTTITSNDLKYNLNKNTATGDGSTKTTIRDKGITVITSDSIDADLNTQEATLKGNVKINNKNEKGEVTTGKGEKGFLRGKKKEFELIGNPVVENEKTVLTADKIIYNTDTNKVKATGNVLIDYKTK